MRVVQNALAVAAVGAAHEQEDVGVQAQNFVQIVLGQLKGIDLQHLRARTEAGLTGGFGGQLGHQSAGDHSQSAGGGGAGVARREFHRADLFAQPGQRVGKALAHVGLHRGVGVGGAQQALGLHVHRRDLGVGAAEINQQNGLHAISSSMCRISRSA